MFRINRREARYSLSYQLSYFAFAASSASSLLRIDSGISGGGGRGILSHTWM